MENTIKSYIIPKEKYMKFQEWEKQLSKEGGTVAGHTDLGKVKDFVEQSSTWYP